MNDHISGAASRMTEHARILRAGQAPHQQALAADLETLTGVIGSMPTEASLKAVQDELDLANATIEGMKGQLTMARADRDDADKNNHETTARCAKLAEERDEAIEDHAFVVKERDDALAQIETLNQTIVELQGDLEAAKKPDTSLGIHAANVKGESYAELKEQSKASVANKTAAHKGGKH